MAGTLTIAGLAAGLLTGEKVIGPITDTGTAVVGGIVDLALASGDNSISVPVGASHVLIALPAANSVALKLRTNLNSADTGLPLGLTGFQKFSLASGTTSLIVNASSSTTMVEVSFI